MADNILLCSVAFVKTEIAVNENLDEKYIRTSIREVQETKLVEILGYRLLEKLKDLVSAGTIGSYTAYKTLADKCKWYLGYMAMTRVVSKVGYKIVNAGVVQASEEKVNPVSISELDVVRKEYEDTADQYCRMIQGYLLDNRTDFPELYTNTDHEQQPNLDTMASGGIWLGGIRGKILR